MSTKNLVVQLKVFDKHGSKHQVPSEDMTSTEQACIKGIWFKLEAVVCHIGGTCTGGHDVSLIWGLGFSCSAWFWVDDDKVRECLNAELFYGQTVFFLLYGVIEDTTHSTAAIHHPTSLHNEAMRVGSSQRNGTILQSLKHMAFEWRQGTKEKAYLVLWLKAYPWR